MDLWYYLRQLLINLRLDLTTNLTYDRLTRDILRRVLTPQSNCIDVGAHKGEMLRELLQLAPHGRHFAFEALPHYADILTRRYGQRAHVHQLALSNRSGQTDFFHVREAPAYSGMRKRHYDGKTPTFEVLEVPMATLDEVIPPDLPIHFIKIDVEGAELLVLQGAQQLLSSWRPLVLFEFGKGASDFYQQGPDSLYDYFSRLDMPIYTLCGWLAGASGLSAAQLTDMYENGSEFYFLASGSAN